MTDKGNRVEEIKEEATKENQHDYSSHENREALVHDITQILDNLFEPNNLSNNVYLVQRAQGITFSIPVKYIYEENSIKAKTINHQIIDEAIEKAENVVALKKGDVIDAVKPRNDQLRKNITIKGIAKEDENELKQLIGSLEGSQEGVKVILSWNSNPQLNAINIVCKDEKYAIDLFNHLSKTQFKDAPLDCSLNFENLYIHALENMKNKNRVVTAYQQAKPFINPQYQMQALFLSQMSNNYMKNNFYAPNPFYMQNPALMNPMSMGMSFNVNGPMNRPPNQYYNRNGGGSGARRGGGGGNWNKKPRGQRGSKYHKNGYRPSREQTKVEVNESEFPPLSNENQESHIA